MAATARGWTGHGLARERWHGYLFVAPVLLFLCAIVVLPLGHAIWTSFHRIRGLSARFVGLDNYARVLGDEAFWHALGVSLRFTVISVAAHVLLGLALALALNEIRVARTALRILFLTPWMVAPAVGATIWLWLLEPQFGVVNYLLMASGLIAAPVAWLGEPGPAFAAVTAVEIWRGVPFVMLLLLAGLQTIPLEQYEAAGIDGASAWQRFRSVTLPALRPAIVVALIFRTITAIQTFDIPYAMTGGGPGESTETLAMYIHKTTIDFLDFGYGSALAVLMFLVSAAATSVYLRRISRAEDAR